jgi:Domain of unknown function (DUF4424)
MRTFTLAACIAVSSICSAMADDGAASIAAGGLISRRETRVVMAKEILLISEKKIVVDYDFRNDSSEDVTTEVAFPIPPYEFESDEADISSQSFQSFKLWIDGKITPYLTEAKALLNGKDVSAALAADRIDIPTFGHFRLWLDKGYEKTAEPDFTRLPKAERLRLAKEGLFYDASEAGGGKWTVKMQYHWTQKFPAHATVHIRHEYSPVLGSSGVMYEEIASGLAGKPQASEQLSNETLKSFCADTPFLHSLDLGFKRGQEAIADPADRPSLTLSREWVDFVLTTANTWQRPIEDFTLIIERPKPVNGEQSLISFCSPGPVVKLDMDRFQLHLTNFIPTAELHIGFFGLPEKKSTAIQKKK